MNTSDYLLANAKDGVLAFVTKDFSVTYLLFKSICASLVIELKNRNIRSGDRVSILGKNSPFWAAAYLAILKINAIAVPLSTMLSADNCERNLTFVDCKFLFVDKSLYAKYSGICQKIEYFCLDNSLLQTENVQWKFSGSAMKVNRDAALLFTSGTTARPRAVRITHRNIQANTESIIQYLDLSAAERLMTVLPFFYCYGTSLLHTHLRVSGTLVISNTFAYPETVLDLMEATNCTGFAGVPSTYQALLRNSTFPRRKLPYLKKIQQAGGKLYNELLKELINSHPLAKVYVMYGQTEATARLSYLPPELLSSKLGSIGKGIPGVTLSVVRESGEPIQTGEIGEIVAIGDNISPGYLNDPDASREKFSNGLLFTGDMATVDEDGYIYIVDRKSDFIKSYGHRVSSYEIEACVLQIPDVIAAAAVGVPDEYAGEMIKVFVVLRNNSILKTENILEHCRSHLARYMLPKEITIATTLPMNAHGKVIKSELKKMGGPY